VGNGKGDCMVKNIFRQVFKTISLYVVGWIFLYLFILIATSISEKNGVQFAFIVGAMVFEGIVVWYIKNRKYRLTKMRSLKQINPSFYRDILMQFVTVMILFVLVLYKEKNQIWWYYPGSYVEPLTKWVGNSETAFILAYSVPIICGLYFLVVSISWLSYNITKLLFDKRIDLCE